jgi:hypothetical protein
MKILNAPRCTRIFTPSPCPCPSLLLASFLPRQQPARRQRIRRSTSGPHTIPTLQSGSLRFTSHCLLLRTDTNQRRTHHRRSRCYISRRDFQSVSRTRHTYPPPFLRLWRGWPFGLWNEIVRKTWQYHGDKVHNHPLSYFMSLCYCGFVRLWKLVAVGMVCLSLVKGR